jgi:endonuclease YncB( thermonuclease family)
MGLRHRGPRRTNPAFQRTAWACTTTGADQYGRSLASCFIDGEDVSTKMVAAWKGDTLKPRGLASPGY